MSGIASDGKLFIILRLHLSMRVSVRAGGDRMHEESQEGYLLVC
jgi:hypothetical protein